MNNTNFFEEIPHMTAMELLRIETLIKIFEEDDQLVRTELECRCLEQAKNLSVTSQFKNMLKQYKFRLTTQNIPKGNVTQFIDQPIRLNCGEWVCDSSGVRKDVYNQKDGGFEAKYATTVPTLITEILNNLDEGTQKARIAYYSDMHWQSFLVPLSVIASSTKIVDLADRGIGVNSDNAKLFVKYLADLLTYNRDVIPKFDATDKLGWHGDDFVPYDNIKFDGEEQFRHYYNAFGEKGGYHEWLDFVKPLRENIYVRLQFGASLAAPLIKRVNALPFIMHYWGKSGAGKTVGMIAAMSVWGRPTLGHVTRIMDTTVNKCTTNAGFLNNLPYAADELQTIRQNGETYDKLIMSVTEGMGRERMYYNKMEKPKTWATSFLFTGEEPITKENSGGGAKNRVIEVDCTGLDILGGRRGNEIVAYLDEHYGTMGYDYVRMVKVLDKNGELKETYRQITDEITKKCDTTDKQAMSMALVLLADKISSEYFFETEPLRIEDVKRFLKSAKEVDISERAYNFVMNLCAVNVNKFSANSAGEIWGKAEGGEILINKDVLCRQMDLNGFSFDTVKKDWAQKGYLILNSQGRYVHQTHCFGAKGNFIKLSELDITKDIKTFDDLYKVENCQECLQ